MKVFYGRERNYSYTFSPRDSVIAASALVFKGLFQQQRRLRNRSQSGCNRRRNRSRSRNRSHSSSESQKRLRPSKDEKTKALAEP